MEGMGQEETLVHREHLDLMDLLDQEETKVLEEKKDHEDKLVSKARLVHRDLQEGMALMDHLVPKENVVKLDHVENQVQMDSLDHVAQPELMDRRDLVVKQAHLVSLDHRAQLVLKDHVEKLDLVGPMAVQEQLEIQVHKESEVIQDLAGPMDVRVHKDRVVIQDQLDLKALGDKQEMMEAQVLEEKLGHKVNVVMKVHKVALVMLALLVLEVRLVSLDQLAAKDQEVSRANVGSQEHLALMDVREKEEKKDQKDRRDHKDLKDKEERQDHRVTPESVVKKEALEIKDDKDREETQVLMDHQVKMVRKDLEVKLDHEDHKANRDHLDLTAIKGKEERLDQREPRDQQEPRDQEEKQVKLENKAQGVILEAKDHKENEAKLAQMDQLGNQVQEVILAQLATQEIRAALVQQVLVVNPGLLAPRVPAGMQVLVENRVRLDLQGVEEKQVQMEDRDHQGQTVLLVQGERQEKKAHRDLVVSLGQRDQKQHLVNVVKLVRREPEERKDHRALEVTPVHVGSKEPLVKMVVQEVKGLGVTLDLTDLQDLRAQKDHREQGEMMVRRDLEEKLDLVDHRVKLEIQDLLGPLAERVQLVLKASVEMMEQLALLVPLVLSADKVRKDPMDKEERRDLVVNQALMELRDLKVKLES